MLKQSKMSGKLQGLQALNTSPLNNPFCQKMSKIEGSICQKCYSIKMLKTFRSNCTPAYVRNGEILESDILPKGALPFINQAFFRFSAHGELINDFHFINLINICNKNEHCTFALWTKRKGIINQVLKDYNKPDNLILIYSEPRVNNFHQKIPAHFDKIFIVVNDDTPVNCKNRCIPCLKCYRKKAESIIVERIK